MRGNNFITGYAYLLYYKCHKINPNHGGSCMDSTDWIKNKKETINLSIPSVHHNSHMKS